MSYACKLNACEQEPLVFQSGISIHAYGCSLESSCPGERHWLKCVDVWRIGLEISWPVEYHFRIMGWCDWCLNVAPASWIIVVQYRDAILCNGLCHHCHRDGWMIQCGDFFWCCDVKWAGWRRPMVQLKQVTFSLGRVARQLLCYYYSIPRNGSLHEKWELGHRVRLVVVRVKQMRPWWFIKRFWERCTKLGILAG